MKPYVTIRLKNKEGTMNNEKYILPLIANEDTGTKDLSILDNVIGQEEARKKLAFFVKSSSKETPMPTLLFTGSHGLAKTFMASKVALALGRELIEVNCGTLTDTKALFEKVLLSSVIGDKPKTILFDEAHKLPYDITTALLTLLNPNKDNKNYLSFRDWIIEYDFTRINVIFATTDAYQMWKPLVNRCEDVYFSLYDNEELYKILNGYLPNVSLECNKEDLSYACRGRGRDAYLISQNIKRYCTMKGTKVLVNKGWKELSGIFGIHSMGLNTQEVTLMKLLQEQSPISCNNIAVRLGVNTNNVEEEIEVRPRELGFIKSTSRGRSLSEEGKQYLKELA